MQEVRNRELTNWEGSLTWRPKVIAYPESDQDLISIAEHPDRYPSPIRALGSIHSTTRCTVAEGGTAVSMRRMNRILDIGEDTVAAQAGALYIDVAHELLEHGLQFYVNVELGNLSIGSAACGGTKDASMPDEFGQVCSYAIGMKVVTADGALLEVTEEDSELLQIMRSSYGLLGIVYEATFRVKPMQPMSVHHVGYSLRNFQNILADSEALEESMMLYLFPFLDKVTVEYRRYGPAGGKPNRLLWKFRNWVWKSAGPGFGYLVTKLLPIRRLRYALIDRFNQVLQSIVNRLLQDRYTLAADQIIRYPEKSNWTRYTFSIWAFPESEYPRILGDYFEFCRHHYQDHGYRCNLLNVAYRISQDQSSLFSYSFDGNVLTLDPVSTGDSGWEEFIVAYNEFCSARGGVPLFNQTRGITPPQAEKAFSGLAEGFPEGRLETFRDKRAQYDPRARFLSEYFRQVLDIRPEMEHLAERGES